MANLEAKRRFFVELLLLGVLLSSDAAFIVLFAGSGVVDILIGELWLEFVVRCADISSIVSSNESTCTTSLILASATAGVGTVSNFVIVG